MDEDFLLHNDIAKHLYHDCVKSLPIIDYHCHLSAKDIYEDTRFDNLGQIWFGGRQEDGSYAGDHYKWRLMRSGGVPEELITGNGDEYKRFKCFADTLTLAIGNPMYHWCNLELKRYFGIDKPLSSDNAEEIWNKCNELLRTNADMSVRNLIKRSNVAFIGTTDDPTDDLKWHIKIAEDDDIGYDVRPSYRPDKAISIDKPGFAEYIDKLSLVTGIKIDSTEDVIDALIKRLEYFKQHGCVASDHGLDYIPYKEISVMECDEAFTKAMAGKPLTTEQADGYKTAVLTALAKAYHKLNIVMELHYSTLRNVNKKMYDRLGPDTGYDVMAQNMCGKNLVKLLSALDATDELPRTIIFSLNPADNALIDTIIGAFQGADVPGKIQHGPAWWFNDSKYGMEEALKSMASLTVLGNFIGMLTDSRSFLSYTRHEYFRRILCNLIGEWVQNGEYPEDEASLRRIAEGISYYNAKRYFGI